MSESNMSACTRHLHLRTGFGQELCSKCFQTRDCRHPRSLLQERHGVRNPYSNWVWICLRGEKAGVHHMMMGAGYVPHMRMRDFSVASSKEQGLNDCTLRLGHTDGIGKRCHGVGSASWRGYQMNGRPEQWAG